MHARNHGPSFSSTCSTAHVVSIFVCIYVCIFWPRETLLPLLPGPAQVHAAIASSSPVLALCSQLVLDRLAVHTMHTRYIDTDPAVLAHGPHTSTHELRFSSLVNMYASVCGPECPSPRLPIPVHSRHVPSMSACECGLWRRGRLPLASSPQPPWACRNHHGARNALCKLPRRLLL